uniref:USP8 dimerisation domain-containing protein n=1 Tax=Propithecus coquereli TaxID=379532 RepID=A0A2K6GKT5_PROCO
MPAVASVPKEFYLSSSLKDLNKKTEVKPEKISTKSYVHSALKIFKTAEECRLDRDEERAHVPYMKYVTVYNLIKKRPDFKQEQDYFHSILGPANIKKATEEAGRVSESLKLRYEEPIFILSPHGKFSSFSTILYMTRCHCHSIQST